MTHGIFRCLSYALFVGFVGCEEYFLIFKRYLRTPGSIQGGPLLQSSKCLGCRSSGAVFPEALFVKHG